MPNEDLYREDVHAWALDQANRLRAASRLQAPELEGIDFDHVVEEIEDIGVSERRKVEGCLELALRYLIKAAVLPDSDPERRSLKEVTVFLDQAIDAYTPSMGQYIDLDAI